MPDSAPPPSPSSRTSLTLCCKLQGRINEKYMQCLAHKPEIQLLAGGCVSILPREGHAIGLGGGGENQDSRNKEGVHPYGTKRQQQGGDAAQCCKQQKTFTLYSKKKMVCHVTFEAKNGSVWEYMTNFSVVEKGLICAAFNGHKHFFATRCSVPFSLLRLPRCLGIVIWIHTFRG